MVKWFFGLALVVTVLLTVLVVILLGYQLVLYLRVERTMMRQRYHRSGFKGAQK